jgi:hypothetical protein
MKRMIAIMAAVGAVALPHAPSADAVADFYKGKQVKIIIGGGMAGS